jgi:hypothetical protein
MAEVLGLGLSHYPGPIVPPEFWAGMIRTNVSNGRIPPDVYENKARWPAPMLAEWGDDEGVAAAHQHRARLLAGYRRLREELDAFQPDLVLIWGDDQYENFKKDCVPPFCAYIVDEVVCKPLAGGERGPFRTGANAWDLPPDTELRVRGHREAANELTRALLAQDFDVAYAYQTRHERGLAHSFANTIVYLDYDWQGFDYPVIPFHVNCYGNQLMTAGAGSQGEGMAEMSPPAPSPRRCFAIGRATARFFADSPWRVALIASSSWSHGSLTMKHHRLYPDLEADRGLNRDLKSGRFADWGKIDLHQIEDSGQHEVLNWICLAGAMTELGQQAEVLDHVESYVFNSSKCFALFRPDAAPPSAEARERLATGAAG